MIVRILVIGASGLVGSHVWHEAKQRGHEVIGTYLTQTVTGLVPLDLADATKGNELLRSLRPDWVVHAAGWTWVDGCERDPARAQRENCEQPTMLAELCREVGVRFAYFSTTYVFDGTAGPYGEADEPRPINAYARSKWEAEQRIQRVMHGSALIPRIICVWGRERQQKNFVYQVLKALRDGRRLTLPSDQIGNPSWAGDIAAWLLDLVEEGSAGVWNLAGEAENCSRVEWFEEIAAAARAARLVPEGSGNDYDAIKTALLAQAAPRPLHSGARISKIQRAHPRALMSFGERFAREIPGIL